MLFYENVKLIIHSAWG